MLEWLFEPIFITKTCSGVEEIVCHSDAFGLSPIVLVIIGVFFGYLSFASFINKRKKQKVNGKSGCV